jgi:hypothetical protein
VDTGLDTRGHPPAPRRLRLQGLDAEAREAALARAHQRLAAIDPSGFEWSGEVVCAVAVRPDPVGGR